MFGHMQGSQKFSMSSMLGPLQSMNNTPQAWQSMHVFHISSVAAWPHWANSTCLVALHSHYSGPTLISQKQSTAMTIGPSIHLSRVISLCHGVYPRCLAAHFVSFCHCSIWTTFLSYEKWPILLSWQYHNFTSLGPLNMLGSSPYVSFWVHCNISAAVLVYDH